MPCGVRAVVLNVSSQLGLQFDNPVLSDVTIAITGNGGTRRWRCHKVVLASMSSYFHSLFTGGMSESSQPEVVLKDVDSDLMEQVLRLLYGKLGRLQLPRRCCAAWPSLPLHRAAVPPLLPPLPPRCLC